jgi:hypothetical protein
MTEKLSIVLGRWLLRLFLQPVPWALGVIIDASEQDGQPLPCSRIKPAANQCLVFPVGHGTSVLCGSLQNRKRRQFKPLPNQLLEDHIDDVGNIFERTSCFFTCFLHRFLGIFSPSLDAGVIPDQEHVPATDRTRVVSKDSGWN